MSAMLVPAFILVSALFWERGQSACSSHSDCSRTLNSVQSDRTYCCGGTFCCNVYQFQAGVTEDPFLSMSIGGIVGIVIGIVVFLAICGLLIYFLLKGTNKGDLNRKPRSRNSRYKDRSSPPRPGHAIPKVSRSADYDYPPDAFDVVEDRHKSTPPPVREKAIPYVTDKFNYSSDYKRKTPTAPPSSYERNRDIPTVIGTFDYPREYDKKTRRGYRNDYYEEPRHYDSYRHEQREKRRHHPTTDRDYREDHRHWDRDHRRYDYYNRGFEYEDAQGRYDRRYDRR